ncbi:MAG TPA: PH domain-containing protein [Candidatus Saccharimonadales bacterium]|nr:PH domain-containing protein [Candidatus Saccharimonadales bacterium]
MEPQLPQPQPVVADPANANDLIEQDERVLAVVRKHWAGVAGMYAMAVLVLVALVVLGIFVMPDVDASAGAKTLLIGGGLVVAACLIAVFLTMIYIYHKSNLTITNQSLVQTIQRSLFNKKISRLSMSNVEDVNAEQKGIIASMLGYGTLTVQTAGEEDNFVFSYCPGPNALAERILEARQAYAQHHPVV